MLRRFEESPVGPDAPAYDDLHEWVRSLPWVVERPYSVGTPGVRTFGVDCEPLGLRRLWLLTGMQGRPATDGLGLAVIVPTHAADEMEAAGWGRRVMPMPGRCVLVAIEDDCGERRSAREALVLTAYSCAMS
jgi:hypothetical protein